MLTIGLAGGVASPLRYMAANEQLQILHLEDNPVEMALVRDVLETECLDCEIVHVRDARGFAEALERKRFHVVLSDYSLPGYDGFTALRTLRAKDSLTPFIIVSGTLGE